MCFDGSDGSEIGASNVAGSNQPVCVALGIADGRRECNLILKVGGLNLSLGQPVRTIQEWKDLEASSQR